MSNWNRLLSHRGALREPECVEACGPGVAVYRLVTVDGVSAQGLHLSPPKGQRVGPSPTPQHPRKPQPLSP